MTSDALNQSIIDVVLQFEGGFVNNESDRGGATNFGITSATLGRARKLGRNATVEEVRSLGRPEASGIYAANYIEAPGFGRIEHPNMRLVLVDTGVLHGPGRSISFFRQCLSLSPSPKVLGPLDDAAVEAFSKVNDQARLACHFISLRMRAYTNLVRNDHSQLAFLSGWINRVASLLDKF